MNDRQFLTMVYEGGIKQTTGGRKRTLTGARHLFLMSRDIQNGKPDQARRLAARGLELLQLYPMAERADSEAWNLLWGALNAIHQN